MHPTGKTFQVPRIPSSPKSLSKATQFIQSLPSCNAHPLSQWTIHMEDHVAPHAYTYIHTVCQGVVPSSFAGWLEEAGWGASHEEDHQIRACSPNMSVQKPFRLAPTALYVSPECKAACSSYGTCLSSAVVSNSLV